MYEVQHAVDHAGTRLGSVVRLGAIRRSCHLVPKWGTKANLAWTNDNILDLCSTFYVNDFLDRDLYMTV